MSALLQRSRQWRCQQQLLSLMDWHMMQQRGLADEAPVRAVRFAKERKGFENSLSELRKAWAQQRLEKEAAAAAVEKAARLAREALAAQRMQQDIASKAARQAEYSAQQAAERETRLAVKAERLKREQLRAEVLGVAREERRRQLLRQSCSWVTPQTLDQRIQEALDNPVPLWKE